MASAIERSGGPAPLASYGLDEGTLAILLANDFSAANETVKATVVNALCSAIGVNPALSPFRFIKDKGALRIYCGADGYEIIGCNRGVSVVEQEVIWNETARTFSIRGYAQSADGPRTRRTPAFASLYIPLKEQIKRKDGTQIWIDIVGQVLEDRKMKAWTKFYRRAVKTHCGLSAVIPDLPTDLNLDEIDIDESEPRKKFYVVCELLYWPIDSGARGKGFRQELYKQVLGREGISGKDVSEAEWQKLADFAGNIHMDRDAGKPYPEWLQAAVAKFGEVITVGGVEKAVDTTTGEAVEQHTNGAAPADTAPPQVSAHGDSPDALKQKISKVAESKGMQAAWIGPLFRAQFGKEYADAGIFELQAYGRKLRDMTIEEVAAAIMTKQPQQQELKTAPTLNNGQEPYDPFAEE